MIFLIKKGKKVCLYGCSTRLPPPPPCPCPWRASAAPRRAADTVGEAGRLFAGGVRGGAPEEEARGRNGERSEGGLAVAAVAAVAPPPTPSKGRDGERPPQACCPPPPWAWCWSSSSLLGFAAAAASRDLRQRDCLVLLLVPRGAPSSSSRPRESPVRQHAARGPRHPLPNPLLCLLELGMPLAMLLPPTPEGLLDSLPLERTLPVSTSCSSVALASPSPPPAPPPPPALTERTRAISPACLLVSPTSSLVAVLSLAADTTRSRATPRADRHEHGHDGQAVIRDPPRRRGRAPDAPGEQAPR